MLRNTFQHIQGIGKKTEEDIWEAGVKCWDDINGEAPVGLPAKTITRIKQSVYDSKEHLNDHMDPVYFYNLMSSKLHWRLFPDFMDSAVYLDIETTGLDYDNGEITTIALYDGNNILHYTNGYNLDDFKKDIFRYKLIITYNGKSFDIPYIEKYFGIKIPHAHIDLRYILGGLGYSGGLKGCEKAFGIDRKELDGVDGYFAILLWNDYKRNNNTKALETLLAYNIEDVINLDYLMISAYNMMLKDTPFKHLELETRPVTVNKPFNADMPTVQKLRNNTPQQQRPWY